MPHTTAPATQLPIATPRRGGSIPGAIASLVDTLRRSNAELNVTARALIEDHRAVRVELFAALRRAEAAERRADLVEAELATLKARPPVLRRREPKSERKNSRSKPETRDSEV